MLLQGRRGDFTRPGRTTTCDRGHARVRLDHATKYREVAELVPTEGDALGRRPRGQDHKQALALLGEVEPGGVDAARHLERLLDLKDTAHYGVINVSPAELRRALRRADQLVAFAKGVLAR